MRPGLLNPVEAAALALDLIAARGFPEIVRNARGDSAYLRPRDGGPAIRVSNHARTSKQRRNHPDVATSLVIREPKTRAQVEAMVEAALRAAL